MSNKTQKLTQEVRETIENENYYFEIDHCCGEKVDQKATDIVEDSAYQYILEISDSEIKQYAEKSYKENDGDITVSRILSLIADENCNKSGFETITCKVKTPFDTHL